MKATSASARRGLLALHEGQPCANPGDLRPWRAGLLGRVHKRAKVLLRRFLEAVGGTRRHLHPPPAAIGAAVTLPRVAKQADASRVRDRA